MGILRSFNVGVSGLNAVGQGMGVISDNIANAGTTGFKASRAEFQDVLATSLKGIDGGDQFGAGVKLAHIKAMMSQGDIARTDNITDLAINGDGFFKINAPFGHGFSRDGSMHFNKDGELTNSDGYQVLGFQADADGKITTKEDPIKIGNATIPADATSKVDMRLNLDSRSFVTKEFDIKDPDGTSNFNHSLTVYDNIGTARLVNVYYNKEEDASWNYRVLVDGKELKGGVPGEMTEAANGKIKFNENGILAEETVGKNEFNFNNGAKQGQEIKFDFGRSVKEGGDGVDAITQYGSGSSVQRHQADGNSAGILKSLSFDDAGILTASYDNGISRDLAQIAVAKFENNEGLFKVGKNLFKESRKSGQPTTGKPGDGGRGEILSKSLELSNVDIANEFVSLMTSQRNFSANAKTLSTADQMLQDVLSIKR